MQKPFVVVLSAVVSLSMADVVTLKDGTVYKNCTVDAETADSLILLVPVSGGIKETVTVAKEQIAEHTKPSEADLKLAQIQKQYTSAKLKNMKPDTLKKALADLDAAISRYPQGPVYTAAVQARGEVVVLLEEKTPQDSGETLDANQEPPANVVAPDPEPDEHSESDAATSQEQEQQMGNAEAAPSLKEIEAEWKSFDLQANELLKKFTAARGTNPYLAMAYFERLQKGFPGSAALAQATPQAKELAEHVSNDLKEKIRNRSKFLETERNALAAEADKNRANDRLSPEKRQALTEAYVKKQKAIRERENKLMAVYRAARRNARDKGDRWYKPTANSIDAMREIKNLADTTVDTLSHQPAETGAASTELANVWKACKTKDFRKAQESLTEVRRLRVSREYYDKLSDYVRDGLRDQLGAERDARAAAARKAREERDKKRNAERAENKD